MIDNGDGTMSYETGESKGWIDIKQYKITDEVFFMRKDLL